MTRIYGENFDFQSFCFCLCEVKSRDDVTILTVSEPYSLVWIYTKGFALRVKPSHQQHAGKHNIFGPLFIVIFTKWNKQITYKQNGSSVYWFNLCWLKALEVSVSFIRVHACRAQDLSSLCVKDKKHCKYTVHLFWLESLSSMFILSAWTVTQTETLIFSFKRNYIHIPKWMKIDTCNLWKW